MEPTEFEGQNVVLGLGQPQYTPLPALVCGDPRNTVWSCWKLSDADIEDIIKHRRIWVGQLRYNQLFAPTMVTASMPAEVSLAVYKERQKKEVTVSSPSSLLGSTDAPPDK